MNRTGLSQGLCESFTCDIPTPSGGRHPWVEQLLDRASFEPAGSTALARCRLHLDDREHEQRNLASVPLQ